MINQFDTDKRRSNNYRRRTKLEKKNDSLLIKRTFFPCRRNSSLDQDIHAQAKHRRRKHQWRTCLEMPWKPKTSGLTA